MLNCGDKQIFTSKLKIFSELQLRFKCSAILKNNRYSCFSFFKKQEDPQEKILMKPTGSGALIPSTPIINP